MWLFSAKSVWMGYSLSELTAVRAVLDNEGIRYRYKVVDHGGQWNGSKGTFRTISGSVGSNPAYEKQYELTVRKADAERALHLVQAAL